MTSKNLNLGGQKNVLRIEQWQVFGTWAIGIDLFSPPPRTFFVLSGPQSRKRLKVLVHILKEGLYPI